MVYLSKAPLNFIKETKKKYDLIWIDGAHGYPVVCIDIINSLHILKENGLILCDDVCLKLNQSNSDIMYSSIATYETLNELKFLKCELTKKDDIIVRLETEVRHLNQANSILMSRFIRSDGL